MDSYEVGMTVDSQECDIVSLGPSEYEGNFKGSQQGSVYSLNNSEIAPSSRCSSMPSLERSIGNSEDLNAALKTQDEIEEELIA